MESGPFDVEHITLDVVGPVVMNHNYVKANDADSVLETFQSNLAIRIKMLERTLSPSSHQQYSYRAAAPYVELFQPQPNTGQIERERYQRDAPGPGFKFN